MNLALFAFSAVLSWLLVGAYRPLPKRALAPGYADQTARWRALRGGR